RRFRPLPTSSGPGPGPGAADRLQRRYQQTVRVGEGRGEAMKTDARGCSTCAAGKEQYETFHMSGREFVQYDYRHTNGKLFSCVAKSLEAAQRKRDKWLEEMRAATGYSIHHDHDPSVYDGNLYILVTKDGKPVDGSAWG